MSNTVSSYRNYPVANTGINQQQLDATINKSKEAVNTTVESNALLSSTMGMDKESAIASLPLVAAILFINNVLMAGKEEKSLVGKFAKMGDAISNKFNLQQTGSKLKPKMKEFANGRFAKYFGENYKAIPKSSMGKAVKMSEKYADALVESLGTKVKDLAVTKESPVDDILKAADDFLLKNPNNKHIQGLRNMLNAANSNVGQTNLGKIFARSGLKAKEIVFSTSDFLSFSKKSMGTLAMDAFSIVLFASVLRRAIKESKEAPQGEKVSTFSHILLEDWAPLLVWQPATKLAYYLGGNKYRGMTPEARKKVAEIVKNANNPVAKVSDAKIVKTVDELLEGIDIPNKTIFDKFKAFFIKDKARMQHSLLWSGVDEAQVLKLKDTSWLKLKFFDMKKLRKAVPEDVAKMMSLKHTLFSNGVSASEIDSLVGKTIEEATTITNGILTKMKKEHIRKLNVSDIQKKALLKGAKVADVESLVGKTAEEAAQAVKGFATKLDLKWWEKPLKKAGQFLAAGLDDIPQTTLFKKFAKKAKGFGFGAMRFVLILFVLQPLLQKPITKLGHMIFGKPETYLKKKEAEENKEKADVQLQENQEQAVPEQNPDMKKSTNVLEQYLNKTQSNVPVINQTEQTEPTQQQDPSAALNLFKKDKNEYNGYIPSIKVDTVDNSEQELEAQVDAILKEVDPKIARLRKMGFNY